MDTKKTIGVFLNGLLLVLSYTGFVIGNEDAALYAMILIWFGAAIMLTAQAFIVAFFKFAHNPSPELSEKHAKAVQAINKMSHKTSFKREFIWDAPVIIMALFGGAYVAAAVYSYQLYVCWWMGQLKYRLDQNYKGDIL